MYGDCQVMPSSMAMMMNGVAEGNMVSSADSVFSPIRNTSLGYMPLYSHLVPKEESGGMMMMGMGMGRSAAAKEEEMESGSGSGHVDGTMSCGEEHDNGEPPRQDQRNGSQQQKRKRYHRHTTRQIQEMEALFKECPHPDDKQRLKLSQELGLKPSQVKFWFQNRRTQMKAQQDRADNAILRAENESLKNDNFRLQAALRNVICPNCGGQAMLGEMSYDEQHLRVENARLKEEIERLSCGGAALYTGRPLQTLGPAPVPMMLPPLDLDMSVYSRHFDDPVMGGIDPVEVPGNLQQQQQQPPPPQFPGVYILEDPDRAVALDLAMTAAEQLVRLCSVGEPLWVKRGGAVGDVLDVEEYRRVFQWPVDVKQQQQQQQQKEEEEEEDGEFRTEATRDSGIVMMNAISLVDAFLDANKWMELFPTIVSKAKTLQIISNGISGHGNGSLLLMYAEFQVLSPLVPAREAHFLRYCQQNSENGTWTIVDFSIDGFLDGLQMQFPRYRRRPSGCIIQDVPNGYTRVTWIEHADVEDKPVHQIFNQLVSSGTAFAATRWLSILKLQCERQAGLMATNSTDLGVIPSPEARKNMMRLSQRMITTFCANISSSNNPSWTLLSESSDDTVRIATRKNMEPGQPQGVILTAVSTTWLPFSHHQVLDLLTDERQRSQLDVLFNGSSVHEVAHVANGQHHRNCVSLLRINAPSNSSQNVELLLQESSTESAGGSLLVYSTVDVEAVQVAMNGEDTSCIPLLPTGFVLLPAPSPASSPSDASSSGDGPSTMGCLLTVGMQVLASAVVSAKLNLSSINSISAHLCSAVSQITAALGSAADGRGCGSNGELALDPQPGLKLPECPLGVSI